MQFTSTSETNPAVSAATKSGKSTGGPKMKVKTFTKEDSTN